jgi:hypothetical protein
MSHVSESALKKVPKQPLNAYFKFRAERLAEMTDDPDRVSKVKGEWDEMPEKEKKALETEYKDAMEQYKKDLEEWKTKHDVDAEDWKLVKERVKVGKKGDKSKGSKATPKDEKKSKSKDTKADKNDKNDKKVEVAKEKPKEEKKGAKSKGK